MVGERLKFLRERENLTQQELADKLKITRSALSLYETNRREPDNDTLKKFAEFFSVTTDYLLGRDEPSTKTHGLPQTIAAYLPEGFSELSDEAKKEVLDFIDYIKVKYDKKKQNENS